MDETTVADIGHSHDANNCNFQPSDACDIDICLDSGDLECEVDCDFIDDDTNHLVDKMIDLTRHSSDVECNEVDDDSRLTGLESCPVEDFTSLPTEEILDTVIDLTVDYEVEAGCGEIASPAKTKRFWSLKGTWKSKKSKRK